MRLKFWRDVVTRENLAGDEDVEIVISWEVFLGEKATRDNPASPPQAHFLSAIRTDPSKNTYVEEIDIPALTGKDWARLEERAICDALDH